MHTRDPLVQYFYHQLRLKFFDSGSDDASDPFQSFEICIWKGLLKLKQHIKANVAKSLWVLTIM